MVNGKYHTIHKVLYIPGGCAGFLPSKVTPENGQMLGLQKKEIYIICIIFQLHTLIFGGENVRFREASWLIL